MNEKYTITEIEGLMRRVLAEQNEKGLRDYFAMAALQGMLVNGDYNTFDDISIDAYNLADAMLRIREK